jgi:geranylgeranyl pyrophosphate synthase
MGGDLHLGEAMAINAGILLQALGYELLAKCGSSDALVKMLRGVTNTAYGQSYDAMLEFGKIWAEEDIIALHKAKTAIYTYENPLLIGAYLADLGPEVRTILSDYAMDGGVAFQLQDDILGVFGTPEKTGKSADSDLKQGKCTLLVLKAFDRPEVQKVWGDMQATRADLDAAKQVIIDSGSLTYSRDLAKKYAQKAATTANKLRDLKLNPEAIDYIQGVAEYMVTREV